MKLIFQYTDSDEYTYYAGITIPVEYESEEALICDFEAALDIAILNDYSYITFLNIQFLTDCFVSISGEKVLPRISTLDEWWSRTMIRKI